MTGIYIHLPFCKRKCPYCAFYSGCDLTLLEDYTGALCRNIEAYEGQGIGADTVYFGGGTPSLMSPEQVGRVLESCAKAFVLDSPEVTLEANPSSVTKDKLKGYRSAGVNRLSLGIQSLDDKELSLIGRLHDSEEARRAADAALSAGFDNISGDLMIGIPAQTLDSFDRTVSAMTELPLSHISAYMLKLEEETPFGRNGTGAPCADEETVSDMYLEMVRSLESRGFLQYEISNFSLPGRESRHNMKYWRGEEYLGFGAGAHSFFGGCRYAVPQDTAGFIASPLQQRVITDQSPDRGEEYVMLGLRLREGIDLDRAGELLGDGRGGQMKDFAQRLCEAGLAHLDGSRLSLVPEGFLVSNSIISGLLYGG